MGYLLQVTLNNLLLLTNYGLRFSSFTPGNPNLTGNSGQYILSPPSNDILIYWITASILLHISVHVAVVWLYRSTGSSLGDFRLLHISRSYIGYQI